MHACGIQQQQQQANTQYLHQFVLHASLDAVDEAMWTTKEPHLKVGLAQDLIMTQDPTPPYPQDPTQLPSLQTVDRFNNLFVTAFVTPGNARFLLLHDGRSDDNIKAFFHEVFEFYVKVSTCPTRYWICWQRLERVWLLRSI